MHIILIVIVVAVVLYILFKAAKVMIKIVAVLVILLAAYFTNPDLEAHQEAVARKATAENTVVLNSAVSTQDLKVMSLTKTDKGIVGIGVFTKVWIFRL